MNLQHRCTRCNTPKPVTQFHRSSSKKSGCQSWCIPCEAEYRATNKASRSIQTAKRYKEIRNLVLGIISPNAGCQHIRCLVSDPDMLEIHHKNGGGLTERQMLKDYHKFLRMIISGERSTDDLQVLCANHHAKKTRARE